ncbi:MAG: HNH endonuclease [Lachnospiraceae bacterium]|nr:HNH endonuclease [Lachnospiraceae bacterium]
MKGNQIKTKERVENEIRDAYMAFTLGVQADDFDKYLRIIVDFLDFHREEISANIEMLRNANYQFQKLRRKDFQKLSKSEYAIIKGNITKIHGELEDVLLANGCSSAGAKDPKANCRKIINTYIKTGFVKPLLNGYVPECKMYLESTDNEEKKYIKGQVFYQYGASSISYEQNYIFLSDGKMFKDIQFVFETLYRLPEHCLSRKDIIALMITVPFGDSKKFVRRNLKLLQKGYLTREELDQQYNFSKYIFLIKDKTIDNGLKYFESHFNEILKTGKIKKCKYEVKEFNERKYNQIDFMMNAIADYPGIERRDTKVWISMISEDWENQDKKKSSSKRSNVRHQIYRNYLLEESRRIYGEYKCYVDKLPWKALVASHIVAFNDCEGYGHKEWEYDGDNGLLLSPNIDAYFDKYDITFDDYGKILLPESDEIVKKEIKDIIMGYSIDSNILNERRKMYLAIHRDRFFAKVQ